MPGDRVPDADTLHHIHHLHNQQPGDWAGVVGGKVPRSHHQDKDPHGKVIYILICRIHY